MTESKLEEGSGLHGGEKDVPRTQTKKASWFCSRGWKNKFTLTEELCLLALHISMRSTINGSVCKQKPKPQKPARSPRTDISTSSLEMMSDVGPLSFRSETPYYFWITERAKGIKKLNETSSRNTIRFQKKFMMCLPVRTSPAGISGWVHGISAPYLKVSLTVRQTPSMVSGPREEQSCLPSLRPHFFFSAAASKPRKHDNKI